MKYEGLSCPRIFFIKDRMNKYDKAFFRNKNGNEARISLPAAHHKSLDGLVEDASIAGVSSNSNKEYGNDYPTVS